MEKEEKELSQLKTELTRIKSIKPDDNLRFLQNQIEVGNITTSDTKRVLNILNEIDLGIKKQDDKINSLTVRNKKKAEA